MRRMWKSVLAVKLHARAEHDWLATSAELLFFARLYPPAPGTASSTVTTPQDDLRALELYLPHPLAFVAAYPERAFPP